MTNTDDGNDRESWPLFERLPLTEDPTTGLYPLPWMKQYPSYRADVIGSLRAGIDLQNHLQSPHPRLESAISVGEARVRLNGITRRNRLLHGGHDSSRRERDYHIRAEDINPQSTFTTPPTSSTPPTSWSRGEVLSDLYETMGELSEEHSADRALIERRDDNTAAIVLEFDLPEADHE